MGTTPVGTCRPGEGFGELALLYDTPRAATVRCSGDADGEVWALERAAFRAAGDGARDDRGDFDWNKLLAKEIVPPWVPPLKSEYDTSQFDSYPDDELPWAGCDLSTVTLDAQTELLFRDF